MIWAPPERRQVGARLAAPIAQLPGRCALTSSTPDALWSSRSVRLLKPAAVEVRGLQAEGPGGHGALNGLDLSVLGENLLDRNYRLYGSGLDSPGRNVHARVSYRF